MHRSSPRCALAALLAILSTASAPASPPTPIQRLVAAARDQGSEALVVLHEGEVLVDETFGFPREPIYAMSVSKSVTAMAIAHLVESGKLRLDQPLAEIFPGWSDLGAPPIRLHHLLEHTSGLDPTRAFATGWDILTHARQSPRRSAPGERFVYNNNACDLLAAVVPRVAGVHLDAYLETHVFGPLEITGASWRKDSAGVPWAAGSLRILPRDLARLGRLMLQGGLWNGRTILGPEAHSLLVTPQAEHPQAARLWWMLQDFGFSITPEMVALWVEFGLPRERAADLEPLFGRTFPTREAYFSALREVLPGRELADLNPHFVSGDLPWTHWAPIGPPKGYAGRGWLGQYLVVLPDHDLVAVRMRRKRPEDDDASTWADTYPEFERDVLTLAEELRSPPPPNSP